MTRHKSTKKSDQSSEGKSSEMHMRVSVWVEDENCKLLFGEGRFQILEAVAEHGSLSAAAGALAMSYRGLWARIRFSEKRLGFSLLESHAGRGPTSGTSLTTEGQDILDRYRAFRDQVEKDAEKAYQKIFVK
jgi:molybdate transport system regulatory protein